MALPFPDATEDGESIGERDGVHGRHHDAYVFEGDAIRRPKRDKDCEARERADHDADVCVLRLTKRGKGGVAEKVAEEPEGNAYQKDAQRSSRFYVL